MSDKEERLSELGEAALAYVDQGFAVIPLRPRTKEPMTRHGLKDWTDDPESVRAIWARYPDANVGIVCGAPSKGLVVVDLDTHEDGPDGYDALRAWEREHGPLPDTCTAVTGSGGTHMLFRASHEVRPSANAELAVDVRGDGSYIVAPPSVHPSGRRYEWEVPPDEAEPAPFAFASAFVESVRPKGQGPGEKLSLPDTIASGGRNNMLFKQGASMRAKRVDAATIADTLHGTNARRCNPPLPSDEVDKIVASVLALPEGRSAAFEASRPTAAAAVEVVEEVDADVIAERPTWLDKKGRVVHNAMGRTLLAERHVVHVNKADGILAIWNGSRYDLGTDGVDRACIEMHDGIRARERSEVREYVRLTAPVKAEAPAEYIAFANGVLDVDTGEVLPLTPDLLIANVIPHDYDPALDPTGGVVDRTLDKIACGDPSIKLNLMEVLGLAMLRSAKYAQCAILTGEGSNGKSCFTQMVQALVGDENYSALDLNALGRPFQLGHLAGKLVNAGDDISNEFVDGNTLANFKSVVSGESVFTDVKNGTGFVFRPYALFVFSCNEFPRIGDTTSGTLRRFHGIPFRARFSKADPDYDPDTVAKVTTEQACREMIALGLAGLQSVAAHNGFTPTEYSERIVSDIQVDSDTVAAWAADAAAAEWIDGQAIKEVYAQYTSWCLEANVKPISRERFTRKVNALLRMRVGIGKDENMKSVRMFQTA